MRTFWRASAPGRYIELEWQHGVVYFEDGPEDWPRRGHEGGGGSFTLYQIRDRGQEWFEAYDGLYDRVLDDLAPYYRVIEAPHGVVATLDADLTPCPTPCRFFVDGKRVYVYPADNTPSRQLATDAQVCLLVSEPAEGGAGSAPRWWARLQGSAVVVDDPEWELQWAADRFTAKYGAEALPHPVDIPTLRIDLTHWW